MTSLQHLARFLPSENWLGLLRVAGDWVEARQLILAGSGILGFAGKYLWSFQGFVIPTTFDYLSYRNERWSEYFPWHVYWILNFCFKMGKFLLIKTIHFTV